ncbi:hypothetical protein COB55_06015 [Candidatus Wolfebacteria bacterium]|nr:MAG: hypothetical protein COB55_06015 [Candidatus Wolfebacteria bacterium]
MKSNHLRKFIKQRTRKGVQRNILFIYMMFLLTGGGFFYYFNHLINSPPVYITIPEEIYIDTTLNHDLFLYSISIYESGNSYRTVNRLGYLGKYQFSISTLKMLGINCTPQEFINQPQLQEHAMDLYLRWNKTKLKDYIGKYQFTYRYGIYITESGLLAASHLGGVGNVRRFLRNGYIFEDANGTPITLYMKKFSGYSLEFK